MKPDEFVAAVRDTMRRRDMDAAAVILAAVSGGPDSLALAHALHRLEYPIEIAHFDHGMRDDSAADAAFVEKQAVRLGVRFHLGRPEPGSHGAGIVRGRGESPEEAMRRARLAFLEQTAERHAIRRIATGHTLDDQAETVLMRAITGAGRRGLAGIPPVRHPYIRPLIDLRRADTEAFCRALRLRPRHDPTNGDDRYLRNAIRADLLPLIASRFNRRVSETLARAADVLRDEDALLDSIVAEAVQAEAAAGTLRVRTEDLAALHPALQRRAIRRLAPLDAEATERVRVLSLQGDSGDQLFLPGRLNARLEYGWLVVGPATSSPARPDAAELVLPGVTDLPGWAARMRSVVAASRPDPLPDGFASCALDANAAGEPLTIRTPRRGDRFRPLGMSGFKTLADVLSDAKVPRDERAVTPVVAGPKGIVWVVGHRIDDRCKVTRSTRRVLVLEWESA